MTRAFNVFFGMCLVFVVWVWMFQSTEASTLHGWGWVFLVSKILTACYITGPIYREYLR